MAKPSKAQEVLSTRLADILTRLNEGKTLDVHQLAEDYGVSLRTAQRDINRLSSLLNTTGQRYYSLDKNRYGQLSRDEIGRICRFASICDLFPKTDRQFFEEKLQQSITIKGFQYENIKSKETVFKLLTDAIAERRAISFDYTKVSGNETKSYRIEPYHLVNKNGIWYLIGLDDGQQKTFCFTQIDQVQLTNEIFVHDEALLNQIKETDSIYHGNHISEIIIKVSAYAAGYFLRRTLLPNQETVRKLDDGSLLLACKNINPMEILPIVQYWIPHIHIVSPVELQEKVEQNLQAYLNNH